jgi:RNA polymerase sigma-70 factor (ECF subfamily)
LSFLKSIPSSTPDAELVAAYKATGDKQTLGELYGRYMDLIYGVCLKYLKQPENAQDSTILIFEELCTKLLKHEVEHFRAWLFTLAKNHCLMRLRSEKKHKTVDFDVALVQSPEEMHLNGVLEKEENFKMLSLCMDQLDQDQKKSIELFYLQGKCYNEIAAITGLEWNKVRSFIQNGKRNLKICMEKQKATSVYNHE